MQTTKELEEIIREILIKDGPDGHADGSDIIADFISSLLVGKADAWLKEYRKPGKQHFNGTFSGKAE